MGVAFKSRHKFSLDMGGFASNAAKVAICKFKSHFLSVLSGTVELFPLHLWDSLLPQTKIILHLLRQSNATPTVSAYAHLSKPFDYNKMPLAPMGCEVQIHKKMDKHGTWLYHSVDRWYLATSPKHYHVHNCYVKATQVERLTNTIQFKHTKIPAPQSARMTNNASIGKLQDAIKEHDEWRCQPTNGGATNNSQQCTGSPQPVTGHRHATSSEGGVTASSDGGYQHST
jgi:hypothetical protein